MDSKDYNGEDDNNREAQPLGIRQKDNLIPKVFLFSEKKEI
jgi:hypothetical protein